MTDYEAFQLELSLHMKTWRQLEQAQREKAMLTELLNRWLDEPLPITTRKVALFHDTEAVLSQQAEQQPGQSGLVPEGYVLLPKQCTSWLEDVYDYCCQGDGSLYLPTYDAMVEALEEHQKELLNNG